MSNDTQRQRVSRASWGSAGNAASPFVFISCLQVRASKEKTHSLTGLSIIFLIVDLRVAFLDCCSRAFGAGSVRRGNYHLEQKLMLILAARESEGTERGCCLAVILSFMPEIKILESSITPCCDSFLRCRVELKSCHVMTCQSAFLCTVHMLHLTTPGALFLPGSSKS